MDVEHVVAPDVLAELADRLEERQALDVADRAADLGDQHVDVELLGEAVDAALDLVRDVRDDLDGAAQKVAAALLLDDGVVDAAGRDVGVALDELVDEALVVAQVEVGLGAVFGDEHLAVLVGAHRAGVDVDVRVELLVCDLEAAGLQQPPDRRRRDALAETGHHAPSHEDVLRHAPSLVASGHVVVVRSNAVHGDTVERGNEANRRVVGSARHMRAVTSGCAASPDVTSGSKYTKGRGADNNRGRDRPARRRAGAARRPSAPPAACSRSARA